MAIFRKNTGGKNVLFRPSLNEISQRTVPTTCPYDKCKEDEAMQTQLLTYKELAQQLALKVPSARKLVQRKRWQRITGNDGVVRIHVPTSHLEQHDHMSGGTVATTVPETALQKLPTIDERDVQIARLEEQNTALTSLVSEMQLRFEAQERHSSELKDQASHWRKLAERTLWQRIFGIK